MKYKNMFKEYLVDFYCLFKLKCYAVPISFGNIYILCLKSNDNILNLKKIWNVGEYIR